MNKGYSRVRPLEGGLEAWVEAGFDVERVLIALQPLGAEPAGGA